MFCDYSTVLIIFIISITLSVVGIIGVRSRLRSGGPQSAREAEKFAYIIGVVKIALAVFLLTQCPDYVVYGVIVLLFGILWFAKHPLSLPPANIPTKKTKHSKKTHKTKGSGEEEDTVP